MRNDQQRRQPPKRITPGAVIVVTLLLILPGAAAFQLCPPLDFRWVIGYWTAISIVTHVVYARDKKKAELGTWRTPESTLHLLEFIGGWAAAFLAQREFRHKISKGSYQGTFWSIVILYQILAAEFLLGGAMSRALGRAFLRLVSDIA